MGMSHHIHDSRKFLFFFYELKEPLYTNKILNNKENARYPGLANNLPNMLYQLIHNAFTYNISVQC